MTGPLTSLLMQEPPVSPVPTNYPAALQVSQGKTYEVTAAKARLLAARAGTGDAAEAYLQACDKGTPDEIQYAKGDLRDCVRRMQAEERLLEQAERALQDAAATADRMLG